MLASFIKQTIYLSDYNKNRPSVPWQLNNVSLPSVGPWTEAILSLEALPPDCSGGPPNSFCQGIVTATYYGFANVRLSATAGA